MLQVYVFPQYPGDADLFVSDYTNPTPQFLASNWSCITDYTGASTSRHGSPFLSLISPADASLALPSLAPCVFSHRAEVVAIQAANCPGPSTCQFYASTTPYYAVNTTYQVSMWHPQHEL